MEDKNKLLVSKDNLFDYTDIYDSDKRKFPITTKMVGGFERDVNGKAIVELSITTFKEKVENAKHYYGRLKVGSSINIELKRPLTEEFLNGQDTENPYSDYYHYVAGMCTARFDTLEELFTIAQAVFDFVFNKDEFVLLWGRCI